MGDRLQHGTGVISPLDILRNWCPVGSTTGALGTRLLITLKERKTMDNPIKKDDLVITASWPMVATLVTSVVLLKLVKRTIQINKQK